MMKMSLVLVLLIFSRFNQFQAVPLVHLNGVISEVTSGSPLCETCLEMMNKIKELVDKKASEPLIVNAAIDICESYQSKISDDRVCKLIVPEFKVLIYQYIYCCLLL